MLGWKKELPEARPPQPSESISASEAMAQTAAPGVFPDGAYTDKPSAFPESASVDTVLDEFDAASEKLAVIEPEKVGAIMAERGERKSQLKKLSEEELKAAQEQAGKATKSEQVLVSLNRITLLLSCVLSALRVIANSLFALACLTFLLAVVLCAYYYDRPGVIDKGSISWITGVFIPFLLQMLRLIYADNKQPDRLTAAAKSVVAQVRKSMIGK